MKKKWIVCLALSVMLVAALVPVTALAAGGVAIDEKNFPDQTFRDYISANFDADKDGVLSAGEVGAAEEIDLAGTDTANLAGLASFPELKKLDVSGTKVTAVNPTKNPALESLNISGCAVKSLDVTRNAALKELDASGTQLTAINVSKNPALEILRMGECKLKTLDVSKNPALRELDCTGTGISALDVTGNEALEILACGNNKLTVLDVTKNPALKELYCQENKIPNMDISENPALEVFSFSRNGVRSINVAGNPALRELYCAGNALTALYLDENQALERLDCSGNQLTELSVKLNPALTWLECGSNAISSLNVTNNRWLRHLGCVNNALRKLVINKNPDLSWVECWGNDIHALDIRSNSQLMDVYNFGSAVEYKSYTVRTYAQGSEDYEIGVDSDVILQDGSVAAPVITSQPKDASATEGKDVTFSMSAMGEGLHYQWYYREPGNETWYPVPGETGRTLKLTVDKKINGNRYMCEVINKGGLEQTDRVRLTVISKPVITRQPGNQVGVDGDKVSFLVVADGEQLKYQWYRLTPNSSTWDKVNSGTSAKLTLTANAAHDGTKYRCVVSNEAGKVTSAEAKLTTLFKPSVTGQPVDANVKKGEYTTFTVKASGGGLKYQWYMKLKGETSWTLMKGETSRTLEVRGTPKRDRSMYRCKITNGAGHVFSNTVTLYVT